MIKTLIDLIKQLAESNNLPKVVANELTIKLILLSILFSIFRGLFNLFKRIVKIRNRKFLNRNLSPFFSPNDVIAATRYFIPTKFQNVSPSLDDEPGSQYLASAKQELMPLLLKKILPRSLENKKFFLILADTGMGKTTFLINLYLRYKNLSSSLFPWELPLPEIYLYPLGAPDILDKIFKITNKENSIILLDAFDEDVQAVENYSKRLAEILAIVNEFNKIVITCRTQFFPSSVEEPYETGYFSYGNSGPFSFQKIYLSVFDDNDVKRYLRKRFPFYNIKNISYYFKAKKVIKKCQNLVVRPMLLTYVSMFIKEKEVYTYSYQIYEVLINNWIKRESLKRRVLEKYTSPEKFQKVLYKFLLKLAWDFYVKRKERSGYFIPKNEVFAAEGVSINDLKTEDLNETDKKTRSLLNRDSEGKYKFAHKSILEFFIAKLIFLRAENYYQFNFVGMDATKAFFVEMVSDYFNAPLPKSNILCFKSTTSLNLRLNDSFKIHLLKLFPNLEEINIHIFDSFAWNIRGIFFWGHSFFTLEDSYTLFLDFLKKQDFSALLLYYESENWDSKLELHRDAHGRVYGDEHPIRNEIKVLEVLKLINENNHDFINVLRKCNTLLDSLKKANILFQNLEIRFIIIEPSVN